MSLSDYFRPVNQMPSGSPSPQSTPLRGCPDYEYSWKMRHPKFGWIGGDAADEWHKFEIARSRAEFCPYPTEIVRRPIGSGQKQKAAPGSVKPSIRDNRQR